MKISLSPKQMIFGCLGLLLVLYILFQARFLILGPQVSIHTPEDAQMVDDPLLTISGKASNIAWISLNDRQIYVDEEGFFSEKLLLSPGTSIITVNVRDRFGREHEESVRVILKGPIIPVTPNLNDEEQESEGGEQTDSGE